MTSIAFIDTEIEPKSRKILDIGSVKDDESTFHKTSLFEFSQFLKGTQIICGHNIFNHDLKYIGNALSNAGIDDTNIIDTLFLSPLLFLSPNLFFLSPLLYFSPKIFAHLKSVPFPKNFSFIILLSRA